MDYTHGGSRSNLLGDSPPRELVERFSNQTRVTERTPPTFIVHSSDDTVVPPPNSVMLYAALLEKGIPVELHVFEAGGHGYGLTPETTAREWPALAARWLESLLSRTE
jgi:dipeptidyl aminopeptidase/acylaminoacyl peptidase